MRKVVDLDDMSMKTVTIIILAVGVSPIVHSAAAKSQRIRQYHFLGYIGCRR